MEKGFGFCTGVRRLWGSSGLQERQWYWYGGTGSLGFQQSWFRKRGTQSFEGKVQVDDRGLKIKEYLGFEVLEGEEGSSFRCPVEVWFLWSRILRIYGFVDSFVDIQR